MKWKKISPGRFESSITEHGDFYLITNNIKNSWSAKIFSGHYNAWLDKVYGPYKTAKEAKKAMEERNDQGNLP